MGTYDPLAWLSESILHVAIREGHGQEAQVPEGRDLEFLVPRQVTLHLCAWVFLLENHSEVLALEFFTNLLCSAFPPQIETLACWGGE